MPAVSVVIVNYRTPRLTLLAVQSALSNDISQVIVIDNDSRDESLELLRGVHDKRLQIIANAVNAGFGQAANRAATEASAPVILFLNSDATLTASACQALMDEVDRYDGRCIAGPRLVGSDGQIQRSAGLLPMPSDLLIRGLGLHRLGRLLRRTPVVGSLIGGSAMAREYETALRASDATDVSMVSGACFAIGRDAFQELGGFDERFFMYFEDADLCRRASEAGVAIRFVPTVDVSHVGGASSTGDYRFSPMNARSMRQYLEKWWGPPGRALALVLLGIRLLGHALTLRPQTRRALEAFRAARR